jgi:hypothetical protein
MKSFTIVLAVVLMLVAAPAVMAQVQHEIALTRAEIQTERQALVAENLPLTEEQAKAFWPMYRTYREEMAKLGDRLVALIEDYAKNYETLTDPQATAMLKEFFEIQKEEVAAKKAWAPKFEKILPVKSVVRFYQIENKLDLIVRTSVAAEIPLVMDAKE